MKKQGIILLAALLCSSAVTGCTGDSQDTETKTSDTVDTTMQDETDETEDEETDTDESEEETDEPEDEETEAETTLDFTASITDPTTGRTLSYPTHWDEIGVVTTKEFQDENEPDLISGLYVQEREAYEARNGETGHVWALLLWDKNTEMLYEEGREGAYTVSGAYVIGSDDEYLYVLGFPSGVEWLMDYDDVNNKTTSEIKYKQLMNESEEVLAHFMEENGITPNALCPLEEVEELHWWKEET